MDISATFSAIAVIAVLHLGFMILEMTRWDKPLGLKITKLSPETAKETTGVAKNMGLYNGFLGVMLLWATLALGRREAYAVDLILLVFIAIAGAFGAVTMKIPSIFVLQSLPALIAIGVLWYDRPYPKSEEGAIADVVDLERQLFVMNNAQAMAGKTPVKRGQHPKMNGCVLAKFQVLPDVPDDMRVGLFERSGEFDALVRFSNARNQDDRDKGGHGMAIKLFGVRGTKVGDEPDATTHDFVLFSTPAFFVGNPIQYVEFDQAILWAQGKSPLGTLATVFLNYYWKHPAQFMNLMKARKDEVINPLKIPYWSVVPYQFGEREVKYSATPVGEDPLKDFPRSKDMIREAMKGQLKAETKFEFKIQVRTNRARMPIEDPSQEWDETVSVPKVVATLTIPKQDFDDPEHRHERLEEFGERLSFSPWHALAEHKPLGGINLTRKAVYEALADLRRGSNHEPMKEPEGLPD